ncbi:UDP-glucuronosyltransferase 2C1-like [Ptychodera flava]|uniref:UDP-glucuronosyltransferase 2C1-like n=1 Tax=Ptychodera flava TaxID=63121 RepID=UPI003969DF10
MASGSPHGRFICDLLVCMLFCSFCVQLSSTSKMLILPGYPAGSDYMVMSKIGKLLVEKGHNVTMLINEGFRIWQSVKIEKDKSIFSFEEYNSVFEADFMQAYLHNLKGMLDGNADMWSTLAVLETLSKDCELLLGDDNLFQRLHRSNYDLILADSAHLCHALVVHKLKIPFISVSTQKIAPMVDAFVHGIPSYPSYVPGLSSGLTDKMTFVQRLKNLGCYALAYFVFNHGLLRPYHTIQSEHGIRPDASMYELLRSSEMAFFSFDFSYEFPRPIMPHVVHIVGILAGPASPLTQEFMEFVESAEHGIVVFSFGSHDILTSNLEKTKLFIRACARLPLKVIMRYDGPPLLGLGDNTKLAKWIPQNDLLGHPKTRAFIAHGGINGVYEAIYHGVPVVGVPLFADNQDNIARLVDKGMAVTVDIVTLSEEQLYQAVTTVIQDKSFKENAMRLSRIHRDQPMTAGESAVYWTEYVLRHGGQHLRPASFDLNVFQCFLVDVVAFLLIICLTVIFLMMKLFSCCRRLCSLKKKKD